MPPAWRIARSLVAAMTAPWHGAMQPVAQEQIADLACYVARVRDAFRSPFRRCHAAAVRLKGQ
mgnify:CR=1 FL=1